MRKLYLLLFVFGTLSLQAQTVTHKQPIIKVIQIKSITYYDSTRVYHSETKAAEGAALGGLGGWLLIGGPVGLIGGSILGGAVGHDTQTGYYTWTRHYHTYYMVKCSDGYEFKTNTNSYYVGQTIIYQ